MLGDHDADRVAAERSSLAGREQRSSGWPRRSLSQARRLDGLAGQGRRALLPAFAGDPDVGAGAEVDVADAQAGELGDAHAGLDHEHQQRVVAAAEPGGRVGRGEQRLDLVEIEVGDGVALVALGRDRHHPRDRVGVLGMLERGETVERVDRPEPRVAGPGAVAPVLFEMGEERADQRRVEIVDVQLEWLLAGLLVREGQQQPERVAVGGDGLRAGVALGDQPLGEERLQRGRERGHESTSGSCSRRRLISSSSSGTASRYQ